MLAFPFGASLIEALLICIIDMEMVTELDGSLKITFNDCFDLPNSIYIVMETVSTQSQLLITHMDLILKNVTNIFNRNIH
jgi:hypothetical protein